MSAPTIPPGGTLLDTFKKSFVDVPIDANNDNAISTTEFLEAAESLTTIFDALGSVAFAPVKNDMIGNIKKIRDRQLAKPAESETLQALVINEIKEHKDKKDKKKLIIAAEGLIWLTRGLDFTCIALSQNVAKPTEELADSFRGAYETTLKPHHTWLVKPIFSAALSACPYRKTFYEKLGSNEEKVNSDMRPYLAALEKNVSIIKGFQNRKEAQL